MHALGRLLEMFCGIERMDLLRTRCAIGLWMLCISCSPTGQLRPDQPLDPVQLYYPEGSDKMFLNSQVQGVAGQRFHPSTFRRRLRIVEPMVLHCAVNYQPLGIDLAPSPANAALNLHIRFDKTQLDCKENLYSLTTDKTCQIYTPGEVDIEVQSAHPDFAVLFTMWCNKVSSLSADRLSSAAPAAKPVDTRPQRPRKSNPVNVLQAALKAPPPPAASSPPSAAQRTFQLLSSADGRDDRHKVLTLTPCDGAWLSQGAHGTAYVGQPALKSAFSVLDASNCDIEVIGMPEDRLQTDISVKLMLKGSNP